MQQDFPYYVHCLEILSQSPLFASLDDTLLEDMLGIFQYETRERGETAISPKQALDRLYIVISGRDKVSMLGYEGNSLVPQHGKHQLSGRGFSIQMNI